MAELMEFEQNTRKVYLDPSEIAEVYAHHANSDWSMIVMKGRKEHCVLGEAKALTQLINLAKRSKS